MVSRYSNDNNNKRKATGTIDCSSGWEVSTRSLFDTVAINNRYDTQRKKQRLNQLFTDNEFQADLRSIDGRAGLKNSTNDHKPTKCYCGVLATSKRVRKESQNKGRYFYCCNKPAKFRCTFFQWCKGEPHTKQVRTLGWRRFTSPEYKLAQTHLLSEKTFSPEDILQGKIGDCWFISAAAVVAERSDLMQQVFAHHLNKKSYTTKDINSIVNHNVNNRETLNSNNNMYIPEDGKLVINLNLSGKWQAITIDNYLPIHDDSRRNNDGNGLGFSSSSSSSVSNKVIKSNLVFAKPGRGNSLWLAYLEKAYAKACGNYHAISGGEIVEALSVLTGYPTEVLSLDDENFESDITWAKLLSYSSCNFPMGAGTLTSGEGIVGQHAYSILEVKEINNVKLGRQQSITEFFSTSSKKKKLSGNNNSNSSNSHCYAHLGKSNLKDSQNVHLSLEGTLRVLRIRNPWGKKEWEGALSSGSDVWTHKLRSTLGMTEKNDGTFWITYMDFMRRFTNIDVVKAHKGWYHLTFDVKVNSGKIDNDCITCSSVGGSNHRPSKMLRNFFFDSSAIEMRVHEATWTQICLFLPNTRGSKDGSYYNSKNDVSILITKISSSSNNQKSRINEEIIMIKSNLSCRNQEHLEIILDDVNSTYRLYFLRYNRIPINCVWKIYSANPISSRQIVLNDTETNAVHCKFRDTLFKTIQYGVVSQQNIFSANRKVPQIYTKILSDTLQLQMLCCGGIGYVCVSNLSMEPINVVVPSFISNGVTKTSNFDDSNGIKKSNVNNFSNYIWMPTDSSVITIRRFDKKFIYVCPMFDEILYSNNGDDNYKDGQLTNENDFITKSTVAYRYNSFLSRFNIFKSTLTQQSILSSEQNDFFSSVSLFS